MLNPENINRIRNCIEGLRAFFSPFSWTTTDGTSDLRVPAVTPARQEFLFRLVKLFPIESRVFAFDGTQFYVGRQGGASLLELSDITCSPMTKSAVPLVLSQKPYVTLNYKHEVRFYFEKVKVLNIFIETTNRSSPLVTVQKFKELLEMAQCSDLEEKFAEFESYLDQTRQIESSIDALKIRIESLQEVTHAYETLPTDHETKKALFLPQYQQASQELSDCRARLTEHLSEERDHEQSANTVIYCIRQDVDRARKIAILTSHVP